MDSNILAEGLDFFEIGSLSVSENNKMIAYSYDNLSRRIYTIYFKNIETGEILEDKIENTTGKAVWSADGQNVFYIRKDKSLRAYQIHRHKIGTDANEDVLIYHEKDDTFDVNVFKTKSSEYIVISSSSTISDEMRFVPANDIFAEWKIIQSREADLEYSVEHFENDFYIITNVDGATNFKLVKHLLIKQLKKTGPMLFHTEKAFYWKVLKYSTIILSLKKEKRAS